MHIYFSFILFLIGLVLASFLNALLYRIDNGYKYPDIFTKSSHCEKCNKNLKTYELIPVISYLIFAGKCKKCGYKIPIYYPLSEISLAISFSCIYYFSLPSILYLVVIFLFILSYFDRLYKEVPAIIVDIFLISNIFYFIFYLLITKEILENSIFIGIVIFLLGYTFEKISKKAFGRADILVLLSLSIVLTPSLYIGYIYIFLILSTIYSLIMVYLKKVTFKSYIPLLPLMYISFSLFLLLNEYIYNLIRYIFYY